MEYFSTTFRGRRSNLDALVTSKKHRRTASYIQKNYKERNVALVVYYENDNLQIPAIIKAIGISLLAIDHGHASPH